jgi:hypothetical protein
MPEEGEVHLSPVFASAGGEAAADPIAPSETYGKRVGRLLARALDQPERIGVCDADNEKFVFCLDQAVGFATLISGNRRKCQESRTAPRRGAEDSACLVRGGAGC